MLISLKNRLRALVLPLVLLLSASLGIALVGSTAFAQMPTSAELRQLQELSPEQRAELLDLLKGQESTEQRSLTEPAVVSPRNVSGQPYVQLKPFGYDLFAGVPSTFAPATDIPIPVNYVVGPGDEIEVQLFGSESASYTLVVTREGVLNFPELGPISVSGLPFSKMQSMLQQRVSEQMIGVRTSISMGRLRSIRVFVLGDAYRPGSYTVSSLTTMTNALFVSGGVNKIGSLRNIQLKRNGQLVTTLDLYDLLLRGDTSGDSRLQPGDVIFVPPVAQTVGVVGEVRRPASYELKSERSVGEVLALAGGLLPTAYPKASQIERINNDRERTIVDVDLGAAAGLATNVTADDVIRVYSVLEKKEDVVRLDGHVYRNGNFQWQLGMRLTDLLPSLNELLPGADPNYVLIRREVPNSLKIEVLSANLSAALETPGSVADVPLRPRDSLRVFGVDENRSETLKPLIAELEKHSSQTEPNRVVSVVGRVRAPGNYPLETGMRISDLIRAGGNLSEQAFAVDAELVRYEVVNGEYRATEVLHVDLDAVLHGVGPADLFLKEHDYLRIDTVPDWDSQWTVTIEGEVRFAGAYRVSRGETLGQLLGRAGGLTEAAFPEGAIFLRESLRQKEREQIDALTRRMQADLASLSLRQGDGKGDQTVSIGNRLLAQLQQSEAVGRLVIDLKSLIAGGQSGQESMDIELRDADRLLVPAQSQVVTIIGETHQNTSHLFEPGISSDDYIDMSGGPTRRADKKLTYVIRANGAVITGRQSKWFGRRRGVEIRPGDTIVVPLDTNPIRPLTFWTSVTQVLYQSAIAVAAIKTFDN